MISFQAEMTQAFTLHSQGTLDKAKDHLAAVIDRHGRHPEAVHLLGIVLHASGDAEGALELVAKAAKAAPDNALFHINLTEMARVAGDLEAALVAGERSIQLTPGDANAHSNFGVALYDAKQFERARSCQLMALWIDPQHSKALNNLGSISREEKNLVEAQKYYERALSTSPQYYEAATNLGAILVQQERTAEALKVLIAVIKKVPQDAQAHMNIGRAFMQIHDLDKAEIGFRNAIANDPERVEAVLGIAHVLREKNLPQKVLEEAKRACAMAPDKPAPYQVIASCYADLGNVDKARECFAKALDLDPENIGSLMGRGHLHLEGGEMEAARQDFETAIRLSPDDLGARYALIRLDKVTEGDENMGMVEAMLAEDKPMAVGKAVTAHFAMGKCYEDLGRYPEAFEHFSLGCRHKRSTITYDKLALERRVDRTIAYFTQERLEAISRAAITSSQPIFVFGMPRSGTTLTESILASHPEVFGAGELPHMHALFAVDTKTGQEAFPDTVAAMTSSGLRHAAEAYVSELDAHALGSPRITDKMPANFQYLGLIRALMPHAKLVHVVRDPLDTCLSSYTRLFDRSQHQSYDLEELGNYYLQYRRLMQHWDSVLPENSYHTVVYEDLIADPEAQAKALLSGCGLEWDPRCLKFYEEKRRVRTASVSQVRQPIYQSSRKKWKNYKMQLAPLITMFEPYL
jgi:tetratricopeptide (TPR) repeat protein